MCTSSTTADTATSFIRFGLVNSNVYATLTVQNKM